MTDFPIHSLLLACGPLMLLGVSVASTAARYLRSQQGQAAVVTIKGPVDR